MAPQSDGREPEKVGGGGWVGINGDNHIMIRQPETTPSPHFCSCPRGPGTGSYSQDPPSSTMEPSPCGAQTENT